MFFSFIYWYALYKIGIVFCLNFWYNSHSKTFRHGVSIIKNVLFSTEFTLPRINWVSCFLCSNFSYLLLHFGAWFYYLFISCVLWYHNKICAYVYLCISYMMKMHCPNVFIWSCQTLFHLLFLVSHIFCVWF